MDTPAIRHRRHWSNPASIARSIAIRPRLYYSVLVGVAALLLLPRGWPASIRGAAAWDLGAVIYLALAFRVMLACTAHIFVEGDLTVWMPDAENDLLFGNAVFQWVPDHPQVLARLLQTLPPGGVLAVQMPDNTKEPALMLMEKVAASGKWSSAIAQANAARNDLPRPEDYYDLLRPLCKRIDIWHTHYNHIIENHAGVVEWFKGSGLRPFLAPLDPKTREAFPAKYADEIRLAYPARFDGKIMLRFPRLFILAAR
jgi:trans-aconitate 2-methyltransferase